MSDDVKSVPDVALSEKVCLTVTEAAAYSGIGINKISALLNEKNCPFVLCVGRRRLVKRVPFEEFIRSVDKI